MTPRSLLKQLSISAAALAFTLAVPAQANTADDLHCIESQFDNEQLAKMGGYFPELEEGEQQTRLIAEGKAAAFAKMADAVDQCSSFSERASLNLELGVEYLKRLSIVRQIGFSNGAKWNSAMESYAPFGVNLLSEADDMKSHTRGMIAAGAHGNGVPRLANDDEEDSDIVAYLEATRTLEKAKSVFLMNLPR